MKNKPSLIDIEAFIQTQTKEKEEELTKIEEDSQLLDHFQQNSDEGMVGAESELFMMLKAQENEIRQLQSELFKVKEQMTVFSSLLTSQLKKKSEIEKPVTADEPPPLAKSQDNHYIKLILQSLVWLKEEKGFSSNDVVKLFKSEGFQPPPPFTIWDNETVDHLFKNHKRNLLI